MSHSLTEHALPGMDARRVRQLADAGLASLEALIAAGPDRLAAITGFDAKTCRALIRVAEGNLERAERAHVEPGVIPFTFRAEEPGSARLARGLKAARRIERVMSIVRKARSHAGKVAPKPKWARAHARARRQLRRLLEALEALQRSVLSDGVTTISHDHLDVELRALECVLQPLLEAPIRKRTLRSMRRAAGTTRRALTSRALP